MDECPVCKIPAVEIDKARGKKQGVKYYECPRCGAKWMGSRYEVQERE